MKMRSEYICPLELTHDLIKGKWKPDRPAGGSVHRPGFAGGFSVRQGHAAAPDYCGLRFTAQAGRYYANFHSEDFEVNT